MSGAFGELLNYIACTLTPNVTMIVIISGLTPMWTTVLAAKLLNERLNVLTRVGCLLCVLGTTFVVLHSPLDAVSTVTATQLTALINGQWFLVYMTIVLAMNVMLMVQVEPNIGEKSLLIGLTICSSFASISIVFLKLIVIELINTCDQQLIGCPVISVFSSLPVQLQMLFFVCLMLIVLQIFYLNRALIAFDAPLVATINYVLFVVFTLTSSAFLFHEFVCSTKFVVVFVI